MSKGEWIAILDHDDLWRPDKLEIQSRSIGRFPEAKLHFANSEWFTDDGKIIRKTVSDGKMKAGLLAKPFYRLLTDGCFIDSETAVMERRSLLELKGFNERYSYIVDYDMFIRMANKYPVYYEDRVLARWRMHPGQATARMEEAVSREYVEVFESVLKEYKLPLKIRDRIKRIMVYHTLSHSIAQLKTSGTRGFLDAVGRGIRMRPHSPRTYLKVLQAFYRASRARLD
jgi:DNA-binding Lrp family transcriptional regulator